MANEEGVKIVITAEDRFTETMKKIDASSKIFGETTKNTQRNLEALEKEMVRLVANGLDPADKKIKEMKANYDKLSQSLSGADGPLKVANQKWMSLSLVVQDLPYGFRGIQNNLPALVGSFAAAGGAIYFVFSALIAITTAYEKEIKALFITTTEAEKQQQLYNNVVKESGTAYIDAQSQVLSLTEKVKLAKDGYIDKQSVINEYNETIGKTIGKQKDLEGVNQALINQGPAYVEYINKLSFAMASAKLVAEQSEKMIKISMQNATEFVDGWDAFFKAKWNPSGIVQSLASGTIELQKSAEKNRQIQLGEAGKTAVGYEKIMNAAFKSAGEAAKKAGVVAGVAPGSTGKAVLKQDKTLLNSLKSEQQLYKDDLFIKRAIGLEVLKEEKRLAVEEAVFNKASKGTLLNIDRDFEFKRLIIEKEALDELQKIRNAAVNQAAKDKDEADKKAEDASKKVNDRNLQNALTALKIESDVATKIANANGKTTSADRIKILENYKAKLYELASTGGYTAEQFDKIADALVNVDGAIAGSQDKIKSFNITWIDTLNGINSTINDFINNSLFALGESIGKVFAGESVDAIDVFGTLIADALQSLGKQLIAFGVAKLAAYEALKNPTPAGAALAIAAGIAAVAAGAALKVSLNKKRDPNKGKDVSKFADGGIISGPTMGLMGEYPGARSNPEVVAPLDKLKDLMNGGGGTLEARISGSDLLILMNKAQRNNNTTF
jgi:hypothetical protein